MTVYSIFLYFFFLPNFPHISVESGLKYDHKYDQPLNVRKKSDSSESGNEIRLSINYSIGNFARSSTIQWLIMLVRFLEYFAKRKDGESWKQSYFGSSERYFSTLVPFNGDCHWNFLSLTSPDSNVKFKNSSKMWITSVKLMFCLCSATLWPADDAIFSQRAGKI